MAKTYSRQCPSIPWYDVRFWPAQSHGLFMGTKREPQWLSEGFRAPAKTVRPIQPCEKGFLHFVSFIDIIRSCVILPLAFHTVRTCLITSGSFPYSSDSPLLRHYSWRPDWSEPHLFTMQQQSSKFWNLFQSPTFWSAPMGKRASVISACQP
jgi:hypothetical protein